MKHQYYTGSSIEKRYSIGIPYAEGYGFSLLEVILAVALFLILTTGGITLIVQSYNSNRLGAEFATATEFASEGIEAVKSIKNQAFSNLVDSSGTGVERVGGVWTFGGSDDTLIHSSEDNFIRIIKVEPVNRDGTPPAGNIVSSGGITDPDTKKITSTVTWNFNSARPETMSLVTYLSDWEKPISGGDLIMMAYSKTTSTPYYRTWDGSSWSDEAPAQAVGGNINYVVTKVSRTRNEAILGTLDSNGNIYAQVWNGSSWGTPVLMANVGSTLSAYRGFDIDYEENGDRAVMVYIPNSTSVDPDYRIWDGNSWSSATTITSPPTSGIIRWIELTQNPLSLSNDIAMIMIDENIDVYGMTWNGSSWGTMGTGAVWDSTGSTADNSGEALFIWGDATSTDQYYRTWNGTSLTGPTLLDIPASGGVANWVELVSRPDSDELMYGVQDAGSDTNTRKWSGSAWDSATQHPEHDGAGENVTSMNFDIVWETHSSNPGKAWILWGGGANISKKQWSGTAWGSVSTLTGSDDTSYIRLKADPSSGAIFAGIYEAATSAKDDIWESHLTDGGTSWSAENTIWTGPISTEPVYFRIDIGTK